MSWQSNLDENDFIIADEEPAVNTHKKTVPVPPTGTHNQAPPTQASGAQSSAGFSWTPKMDLSSAFTPFVTSRNFQESNKITERRFNGGDTLDEPVLDTLKRDLSQIGRRVAVVLWPAQLQELARSHQNLLVELAEQNGIRLPPSVANSARRVPTEDDDEEQVGDANAAPQTVASLDWDLWGPLIFSLAYAVTMGVAAPNTQTNVVFSGTFSFIWLFYLVVGLNIQLLGGTISFLSAISATGYSIFPIVVGAIFSTLLLRWRFVRLIVMVLCALWSIYAASMSLKCSGVLPGRVLLAIYPVALMYAVLSWLVVIT
ncbi:hypothetical protein JCM33374_g3805 [Metschnikowia sp. JCM 33374]|nr:hypothetical protein JCM33374_g3805 [Metschnikowia sp. JCM 33374]